MRAELAARLGVHETHITSVETHPAGLLVSLLNGSVMLVSETVARPYVPEVDDVPVEKPKKNAAKKASGAA